MISPPGTDFIRNQRYRCGRERLCEANHRFCCRAGHVHIEKITYLCKESNKSTKLQKSHRDFEAIEKSAVAVVSSDPYNRSRSHNIKKLEGVAPGGGQYRLAAVVILSSWLFLFAPISELNAATTAPRFGASWSVCYFVSCVLGIQRS